MNYDVTHTTTYEYRDEVSVSHHVLRLRPRDLPNQQCLQHEVTIEPAPAVSAPHGDYFGNAVSFVTVEGAHRHLRITSRSLVNVTCPPRPAAVETPGWEAVRDFCRGRQIGATLDASEFLFDSPMIPTDEGFAEYTRPSFPREQPILQAVLDLTRRIYADFKFDPTATTVATPLAEVFKRRRGVCQDFAHLEIACLRSIGLPARYVSGYLETQPPPGRARLAGADASHAWASFYAPGIGWIDVDPTNNVLPDTRHITVGWGRDFSDVSPVHGVILGTGDHTLKVSVDVELMPEPRQGF